MELDFPRAGVGKRDRCTRDVRFPDDGETVFTKSSSYTSVACSRLGDGRALPVDIVFAPGERCDPKLTPEIIHHFENLGQGG